MNSVPTALLRRPGEGLRNDAFHLPRTLLFTVADTAGHSNVWIEEVPPGAGPPMHIHLDSDEAFHILAGSFLFAAEAARHQGDAGSTVFIPRGTPHTFKNIGSVPGRLLVTMTPGGFERFFLEVEAQGLTPESHMDAIMALAGRHGLAFVGPPL
jgi:quercetin dioxygenase-like cupin family protein